MLLTGVHTLHMHESNLSISAGNACKGKEAGSAIYLRGPLSPVPVPVPVPVHVHVPVRVPVHVPVHVPVLACLCHTLCL